MKNDLVRFTFRTTQELLDKLAYVSNYEGRTKNKELEQLVIHRIASFERKYGPIPLDSKRSPDD